MRTSIEKLQKFFRLEAKRGYDDRAVLGGLESMLESWEADARTDEIPEDLVQAISTRLRDYGRLSPDSRKEALKGLWNRIRRQMGPEEGGTDEKDKVVEETASVSAPPAAKPQAVERPFKPTRPAPAPVKAEEKEKPKPEVKPKEKVEKTGKPKRTLRPEGPVAALNASVTVLDGVGAKNAEKLGRMGIASLGDMLYHFPRRYDDYTQLKTINRLHYNDKDITVIGTIQSISSRTTGKGGRKLVEAILSDGSGALRIIWFNQPWLEKSIHKGDQIVVSGDINQYLGRLVMNNPEWEPLESENLHTNRIVPVYPLTARISQRWLREQMDKVVRYWAPRIEDPLPDFILDNADLVDLRTALLQIHFPDSFERLEYARQRLGFDEIFLLQLGVLREKSKWEGRTGRAFETSEEWLSSQLNQLPYTLTGAQQRAVDEIVQDLSTTQPMNRLLQGDVGSGKTVVAGLAIAIVTHAGAQAAIMAPTSILAEQHYKSMLQQLCGEEGALQPHEIRLMVGATPESEKAEIRSGLENGEIKLVVGTHALIESPVVFQNLQLAIIDEQHRFGVEQRSLLRSKGEEVHLLVMTATPIPRSLALTVYGDLDLSVMDEMPPGRQTVGTYILSPSNRERAYGLIRNQIEEGRQAFIIYPLVEESEKSESKAAVEQHEFLSNEVFHHQKLGLLHGRMPAEEKETVMQQFRDNEVQILVSTSVIEVGVDIPNATVMLIEGANRFGLAQLHQFRGRVGRGKSQAYCLLIPDSDDSLENERLKVMTEINDGFLLAEKDLEQRGPGEFLGTRQSGFAGLQLANITDVHLIEKARKQAQIFLEKDPEIEQPEHQGIRKALGRFWSNVQGEVS